MSNRLDTKVKINRVGTVVHVSFECPTIEEAVTIFHQADNTFNYEGFDVVTAEERDTSN